MGERRCPPASRASISRRDFSCASDGRGRRLFICWRKASSRERSDQHLADRVHDATLGRESGIERPSGTCPIKQSRWPRQGAAWCGAGRKFPLRVNAPEWPALLNKSLKWLVCATSGPAPTAKSSIPPRSSRPTPIELYRPFIPACRPSSHLRISIAGSIAMSCRPRRRRH